MDLDLDKLQREIEHAEQYLTAYRLSVNRNADQEDESTGSELQEANFIDSLMVGACFGAAFT